MNIDKKRPLYQCWWFWMGLILIVFTVWCRLTTYNDSTAVIGTVSSAAEAEEEKQISSAHHEEEDGILYWEGTSGAAFFEALCAEIGIESLPDAAEGEHYAVYRASSLSCAVYIEADPDTDEIHYYKVTVTDWSSADEIGTQFISAADLLGAELVYAQDYTAQEFTAEIEEFLDETIESADSADALYRSLMTSILYTQEAGIVLFTDADGNPCCEVLAMPSDAAADSGT